MLTITVILGERFEHDHVTKEDRKRKTGTEPDLQTESNSRTIERPRSLLQRPNKLVKDKVQINAISEILPKDDMKYR